jgi:hypothetical protein
VIAGSAVRLGYPARTPEWRNGRRSGLKLRGPQGRPSSNLGSGTKAALDCLGVPGEPLQPRFWGGFSCVYLRTSTDGLPIASSASVGTDCCLTPCPTLRGPRWATLEGSFSELRQGLFIDRHDGPGARRRNPKPCSRPQDRPERGGAMVRRMGAVCSAARRGSECLFLGRRARMDRRPTRHGHRRFFRGASASPSRQELRSLRALTLAESIARPEATLFTVLAGVPIRTVSRTQ